jgi:DNA-binding MarR family transcriptional regulator
VTDDSATAHTADALLASVGVLVRRLRQLPGDDALTMPERAALSRLDREGPATSAELARAAQLSPQSMNTTVAALTSRNLVRRDPDPEDGRRVVLSVTRDGRKLLKTTRNTRSQHVAIALAREFSPAELKRLVAAAPLIERLAHSL